MKITAAFTIVATTLVMCFVHDSSFVVASSNASDQQRNLAGNDNEYERPPWWPRYRQIYGKRLLECRRETLSGRKPKTGQSCPKKTKRFSSYVCLFGQEGRYHPHLECTCDQQNKKKWTCSKVVPEDVGCCAHLGKCPTTWTDACFAPWKCGRDIPKRNVWCSWGKTLTWLGPRPGGQQQD